jgi:hypothetical protein
MRHTRTCLALLLVALAVGVSPADDKDEHWSPTEALKAAKKQGGDYRERFEKVGRAGLAELLKDKDTGVSLVAAWELNRKLITLPNPKPMRDSDGTYDPEGMKAFLKHVSTRTGLTVPDWWQKNLLEDLCARKGVAHLIYGTLPERKKVTLGASAKWVRDEVWMAEGETLSAREKVLTFTANKRSISFGETICPYMSDSVTSCAAGKTTVLAIYSTAGGVCPLLGFDHENNKRLWTASVWGWGRGIGRGGTNQRLELLATKDTVTVFGSEFCGVFLESFDLKTGEVRFRFCSSCWGSSSERWNLK